MQLNRDNNKEREVQKRSSIIKRCKQLKNGTWQWQEDERECLANLGLGDDLDGDVLTLVLALLGLGGAGVAEVAAADLLAEVILGEEVLGEAKALV